MQEETVLLFWGFVSVMENTGNDLFSEAPFKNN